MESFFSDAGRIITSRILFDNMTGLSKGVGFIRFDQKDEAERAIQLLNGTTPEGATGGPDPSPDVGLSVSFDSPLSALRPCRARLLAWEQRSLRAPT